MDDVELVPTSLDANGELTGETALGVAGPEASDLLTRLKMPAPLEPLTQLRATWNESPIRVVRGYGEVIPHFELWIQAAEISALWQALIDAGATPVGSAALEAFRVAEGIPVYGIDIAERDLAQETSQLRALSFNKGCYLGQEIVERIRSRGNVHRHLRMLEVFGPIPTSGVELTLDGGAPAGQITSAAELTLPQGRRTFALAMLRGEAELASQSLNYAAEASNGTARILAAPPGL
jgi:folate-binding protein YgfZ